jgi:hypothetical protein
MIMVIMDDKSFFETENAINHIQYSHTDNILYTRNLSMDSVVYHVQPGKK